MKRRFIHRIEVFQSSPVPDGYGGNTLSEASIGQSWAEVKSLPRDRVSDYGLDIQRTNVRITVRTRPDIDYSAPGISIGYNGLRFKPYSVTDLDLKGSYIEILASNE